MQPLHQKCRRKCNPFVRNGDGACCFEPCRKSNPSTRNDVKNATPQAEMQRRNVKNHTPSTKNSVEHATPLPKNELWTQRKSSSGAILGTPWGPVLKPLSLCYNQPYPPVAHKLGCVYLWPCFTLPLHLPGDLLFARPKGALRLSARLIPNR